MDLFKNGREPGLAVAVFGRKVSAAGERLGIAKSVVSRRISQLERRLGSRLLHRTTRRVGLTDAGRVYYERTAMISHAVDDARRAVEEYLDLPARQGLSEVLAGTLSVDQAVRATSVEGVSIMGAGTLPANPSASASSSLSGSGCPVDR